jgi:hypothetical protein
MIDGLRNHFTRCAAARVGFGAACRRANDPQPEKSGMSAHPRTIGHDTRVSEPVPFVAAPNTKDERKQPSDQTLYGRALIKRAMAMGFSYEIANKAVMNLERSGKQRHGEDIISTRSKPSIRSAVSAKKLGSDAPVQQQIIDHFQQTKAEATVSGIGKVLGISAYMAKRIIERMEEESTLTSRICATYQVYSLRGVQCAKFKTGHGGKRGANIKGCEIDNIKFESLRKAELHFNVSYKTITRWAKTGKSKPIDRTRYPRDTRQMQPVAQLEVRA